MKCRSVVGIWPEVPPIHRVTAVTVIHQPPTLYTGAADGSVVWWSISGDDSHKDIKPVALLCGHTCAIAGLGICYPLLDSGNGNVDIKSDKADGSPFIGALISACTDGVLCIWSRGSGHCRRRRKLPPWTGSPSALTTLPGNPRYVCIACCFFEGLHVTDNDYTNTNEGNQSVGDSESSSRKYPKCSIVIVDSYTLTITQTVFHGNLSIGPSRFLSVVAPFDDLKMQSVLLVDSYGKLQLIPILKDSHLNIEATDKLNDGSCYAHHRVLENEMQEGDLVSIATVGRIISLVYKTCCVFMLATNNDVIGEICFQNGMLHSEADPVRLHVAGGMFLYDENRNASDIEDTHSDIVSFSFAAWNNRGLAIVYNISYMNQTFNFKSLYIIPAVCYPSEERLSIDFVKMDDYLLRIESTCFHEEDPLSWKPHVTMWSLLHRYDDHLENSLCQCKTLGGGDYLIPWITRSTNPEKVQGIESLSGSSTVFAKTTQDHSNNGFATKVAVGQLSEDELKYISSQGGHRVASSMVISHSSQTPYAVVYGYYSGEIRLFRFDAFLQESDSDNDLRSQQQFLGHNGPVLCLATHRMRSASTAHTTIDVLLSGSADSTVRVWELSTGKLIMVMHHHVSPVRQIILPPEQIDSPWDGCFLSVGDDCCVALASLATLRVERMFPGHPYYPARVVWDGARGYLACLSQNRSAATGAKDVLYIWDIKTGARERVLRGTASHSMFDDFCKGVGISNIGGSLHDRNTSASSLLVPSTDVGGSPRAQLKNNKSVSLSPSGANGAEGSIYKQNTNGGSTLNPTPRMGLLHDKHPIRCSSPLSGIAALSFDLSSLTSISTLENWSGNKQMASTNDSRARKSSSHQTSVSDDFDMGGSSAETAERYRYDKELSLCFLRFSLSFLHLWDVQLDLDNLLLSEMMLQKPEEFILAPGLEGDRGSVTLAFPGRDSTLELWKSSSEFSAIRSLTILSIAQCMVGFSSSCATASSNLSAFYTRHFAERFSQVKPPSLQLLVTFWQDEDEHIRLAARTLFHCAAARAIPAPLRCSKAVVESVTLNLANQTASTKLLHTDSEEAPSSCSNALGSSATQSDFQYDDSNVLKWLESYEMHDWLSCVGGTSQDAMTSHIIVAAALAIWYPSLVKPSLAMLTVHPLMKLVVAMNEKYSSTAADLLAEGMDSTWKACIASEIPHLIGDIFFQIECVSGASVSYSAVRPAVSSKLRETLVGILLPSLALADIQSFLTVVEGLIWSTASDSPVHLVSIKTLIRVVRASPRSLAQYLNKTMDPSNSVMRKTCVQSSLTALKEVVRVYPMVALNESSTRLAIGDAIADVNTASIHVYDLQSLAKIKVLDASGPPGMPNFLPRVSDTITTAISALTFSQDGEGLVAFSENGLIVRWWSLGSAWWEKLSRNVPLQCTKLIYLPPWEGFSPSTSRASIFGSMLGNGDRSTSQDHKRDLSDLEFQNHLIHNLDLSYRLEWASERKVNLTKQGQMLGTFQL
ncbi:hypothetical protein V2J09_004889 [Rumex salicifolius]